MASASPFPTRNSFVSPPQRTFHPSRSKVSASERSTKLDDPSKADHARTPPDDVRIVAPGAGATRTLLADGDDPGLLRSPLEDEQLPVAPGWERQRFAGAIDRFQPTVRLEDPQLEPDLISLPHRGYEREASFVEGGRERVGTTKAGNRLEAPAREDLEVIDPLASGCHHQVGTEATDRRHSSTCGDSRQVPITWIGAVDVSIERRGTGHQEEATRIDLHPGRGLLGDCLTITRRRNHHHRHERAEQGDAVPQLHTPEELPQW